MEGPGGWNRFERFLQGVVAFFILQHKWVRLALMEPSYTTTTTAPKSAHGVKFQWELDWFHPLSPLPNFLDGMASSMAFFSSLWLMWFLTMMW